MSKRGKQKETALMILRYMLWFNFFLVELLLPYVLKLINIHYHTPKQREIKFKPTIKLNHDISVLSPVEFYL